MRRREHQSGFSTTVILLFVLVVTALIATSIVVYQHHKPINTKSTTAATTQTQTTTQPTSTATTQPAQTTTSYFTIPEWGVRAPNTTPDTFTYILSTDKKSVTVISKLLAGKDTGCATFGAGVIEKFAASDHAHAGGTGPTVATDAQQNPSNYKVIGGNYYIFIHDQAECGSISLTDQNQANNDVKTFVANFQTIPK